MLRYKSVIRKHNSTAYFLSFLTYFHKFFDQQKVCIHIIRSYSLAPILPQILLQFVVSFSLSLGTRERSQYNCYIYIHVPAVTHVHVILAPTHPSVLILMSGQLVGSSKLTLKRLHLDHHQTEKMVNLARCAMKVVERGCDRAAVVFISREAGNQCGKPFERMNWSSRNLGVLNGSQFQNTVLVMDVHFRNAREMLLIHQGQRAKSSIDQV